MMLTVIKMCIETFENA